MDMPPQTDSMTVMSMPSMYVGLHIGNKCQTSDSYHTVRPGFAPVYVGLLPHSCSNHPLVIAIWLYFAGDGDA